MARLIAIVALVAACLATPSPTRAEQLELDLTSHHVSVEFDFSGATLTLFGAVTGQANGGVGPPPDVVMAVQGPARALQVRRKSRIGGIWVNSDRQGFTTGPGYFAFVSNRPLAEIAAPEILKQHELGFGSLTARLAAEPKGRTGEDTMAFSDALVRLMRRKGLYADHADGVNFVGQHLFRVTFRLPADVPVGLYKAEVYLFRDGSFAGEHVTTFDIQKAGFERIVFNMAQERPLLYGILSVLAAIAAGLGASYAFRKG